jgi:hypothetical protein
MHPKGGGVRRRGLAIGALIVASILVGACLVWGTILLVRVVYTPTVNVPVVNDTAWTVTLGNCASDIPTLAPGQRTVLDPNVGDPNAACLVYTIGNHTSEPDHCLDLPASHINPTDFVLVSSARPYSDHMHCGD